MSILKHTIVIELPNYPMRSIIIHEGMVSAYYLEGVKTLLHITVSETTKGFK